MAALWLLLVLQLIWTVDSGKLVFPEGTDVGYIVPDKRARTTEEEDWLNALQKEGFGGSILQRGEREALNEVEEALWRTIENSARLARQQDFRADDREPQPDPIENWHGKWFPHAPKELNRDSSSGNPDTLPEELKDDKHGVAMGIPHVECDNAKINLTMDWDFSPVNYTCFDPKKHRIPVLADLKSKETCVDIPKGYSPQHLCMNTPIEYNTTLPTFGSHRPIWPVYGEYKFVPVQRWLHTIEHGGIVMLYDPCAEPVLVNRLRKLVTGCFRKHVITPYTLLSRERPLALVAWGCSLEMAVVNDEEVKTFIKEHALHGPEGHYAKDGGYKEGLLRKAEYPPGAQEKDSNICP